MSNLGFGLQLMLIGMLTVFVILLIVIFGSRLLIAVINRIAPAEQAPAKASSGGASAGSDVDAVLQEAVAALPHAIGPAEEAVAVEGTVIDVVLWI